jgi:hypothetical protein
MYLSSEFQDRESIIRALRDLRANGVGPDDLDVFSDEPLELLVLQLQLGTLL